MREKQKMSGSPFDLQKGGKVPKNPGHSKDDVLSGGKGKGISATHEEMKRGAKDGSNLAGYHKGGGK